MVWLDFFIDITQEFWGDYGYSILFSIALIAIIVTCKEKLSRYLFLWYTLLVVIFIYNPLTLFVCRHFLEESTFSQYYQRFYSLIPVTVIIAFGFMYLIKRFFGWRKLVATFVALALIAVLGECIYTQDWFTKATNRNKVPQDVVTICDLFADYEGDTIRIMAPLDIAVYLRQMDPRFSMPYVRSLPDEAYELTNEDPDPSVIVEYCQENDVDYVVVSSAETVLNRYLDYGFTVYGYTSQYTVLMPNDPDWILTEYADASGLQGMCYTMYNQNDGTLIVIDGGHAEDEDMLREAIEDYGGTVDAWILTHYHMDHIDAFNEIYEDPQGIDIEQVYVTNLDAELFYSVAQEWDDVDSFNKFLEITADADNINYVARDDVLTFSDNLTITFFNACDEVVTDSEGAQDIPNNDSLVFKMATDNRSILICGDCHSEYMADYLVDTYGEQLDSNILQCGHHGNNSMPTDSGFYELVSPEISIFDFPDDFMTSAQYTAGALAAYLQELGSRIVWYKTAPNVFGF